MVRVMYRGAGDEVTEDLYPDDTTVTNSVHDGFLAIQTEAQANDPEDGEAELCMAMYARHVVVRVRYT